MNMVFEDSADYRTAILMKEILLHLQMKGYEQYLLLCYIFLGLMNATLNDILHRILVGTQ